MLLRLDRCVEGRVTLSRSSCQVGACSVDHVHKHLVLNDNIRGINETQRLVQQCVLELLNLHRPSPPSTEQDDDVERKEGDSMDQIGKTGRSGIHAASVG